MASDINSRGKFWFDTALAAKQSGQTVFAPQMLTEFNQVNTDWAFSDWAHFITAIKAAGWVLKYWTVVNGSKGPTAYPLFELE